MNEKVMYILDKLLLKNYVAFFYDKYTKRCTYLKVYLPIICI
jgi:hypothetical protein